MYSDPDAAMATMPGARIDEIATAVAARIPSQACQPGRDGRGMLEVTRWTAA
jgi:hypothetical protein